MRTIFCSVSNYVKKTTKIIKKMMTTMNILTMSHRLEVIPLKYLSSSVCAASTFVRASSTLSSILHTTDNGGGEDSTFTMLHTFSTL